MLLSTFKRLIIFLLVFWFVASADVLKHVIQVGHFFLPRLTLFIFYLFNILVDDGLLLFQLFDQFEGVAFFDCLWPPRPGSAGSRFSPSTVAMPFSILSD